MMRLSLDFSWKRGYLVKKVPASIEAQAQESSMTDKIVAGRLQKLIIVYSALGILATGAIVAMVSIGPLHRHLKQDQERNLLWAVRTKTLAVEEYLWRAKNMALQIANRTQLREELEAYNRRNLSLDALVKLNKPNLVMALNQHEEVAGISRLDPTGQLLVGVGLPIPREFWLVPAKDAKEAMVHGPVTLESASYLVVSAPIFISIPYRDSQAAFSPKVNTLNKKNQQLADIYNNQLRRVGTDVILLKLDRLQRIVEDDPGLSQIGETVLGSVYPDRVQLFFPVKSHRKNEKEEGKGSVKINPFSLAKNSPLGIAIEKAVRQGTGILIGDRGDASVMAYSRIQGSEWGLVIKIDNSKLYAPVNPDTLAIASAIVILGSLSTGGMVLLLRLMAKKTIIHTDELERLVEQKTTFLPTEQNQRATGAQRQLEAEQRYAIAADSGNNGLWDWNLATNEIYFSPHCQSMLGYDENEIGTHPDEWFNRVHPDDVDRVKAEIAVHFAGVTSYLQNEYRVLHFDGTYRWVRTLGIAIQDANGKAYRMAGSVTDITAGKTAEEENIRLAAFPRNDPNPVLASDKSGNLIYLNPAAQRAIAKLSIDDPTGFLPKNHLQLVRNCLESGQSDRSIDVKIADSVFSWSYHPILRLGVVHLYAIDITERQWAEEQLLQAAWHDGLTGLPNRTKFIHRLEQVVAGGKQRQDELFAVLFLDLDRFKVVNDSLGHMLGDEFLIAMARRLEACLRPGDIVARLGGDEFTILLGAIDDINDATRFADRIQQQLMLPVNLYGHEVFTTASIGIAIGTYRQQQSGSDPGGRPYESPEDLLRDADLAMYRAKALGKARHVVFDTTMHRLALELLQLENDLRRAIFGKGESKKGEINFPLMASHFCVYYQPIVALDTGRIAGFEALVRWQHPERGLISPGEFIPVAEETGMIIPLGAWVLREACCQLRQWQEKFPGAAQLTMSVNLSGKQISQPDLLPQIDAILQQTGIDAGCLKLEITESVLMENAAVATALLQELRTRNIGLCIDDFGTGYSSLSYLHRFPINTLKIDRSFVIGMTGDDENSEIVRAIMMLAHNLGMYVVAEGVETEKHLVQLWALQCEYGQGYFFSRALDSKAAEALMATVPQW